MPSTCEFQLSNPNGVYFSGETVSGTIILTTSSPKDVRDVRIIFKGIGKVNWTETERRRNADGTYYNHTINFRSDELYVDNSTIVHDEGTLPAGTHSYTFQISLPFECPTSCEGRYGHIRYELTLKIKRPFRFDNNFSKPLTVIKTNDLNLNPVLRLPIVNEDVFSSSCWPCASGIINARLTIPLGGYASGQNIYYSMRVENQSMNDIEGYTIEFIRQIIFTAHTPYYKFREDRTKLYKKIFAIPCLRLSTRIFEGNFEVCSTPPSTEGQPIIGVQYSLKLILHFAGCASDNDMIVPICIGSIPIRESLIGTEPIRNDSFTRITPTAPELPQNELYHDLPPSYKELGPPSFEEATRSGSPFMDTDKDEHNRHIGFRPLYPMYSRTDN